jgi:hypothetical protein
VARADNQGHPVENFAVDVRLRWQPFERVPVALEFIARQFAIDDGHINADGARPYAHFLDNERIGIAIMIAVEVLTKRLSDIGIAHVVPRSRLRPKRQDSMICAWGISLRHVAVCYVAGMQRTLRRSKEDDRLSLRKALKAGRLEEFIAQEEARGVGAADKSESP